MRPCPKGVAGTNFDYPLTVSNATNNGSGAIRITTTANNLQTGNRVTISGVGGVANANGNFAITRVSSTTFDLVGSTFSGAYTSGGTISRNVHYLWISGGVGTAEAALITGGTCTSGASSGTIKLYVSNSHSGSYTISSATSGVMEAIYAQSTTFRRVQMPAGDVTLYAPVWLTNLYGVDLFGGGISSTTIRRFASYTNGDLFLVDSIGSGSTVHSLHDFWVASDTVFADSGTAAIRLRYITCCGTVLENIRVWNERYGFVVYSSDDITLNQVEYVQTNNSAAPQAGLYVTQESSNASSNIFVNGGQFITNEGYTLSGVNVLGNGVLIESADGLTLNGPYIRGDFGIRINPPSTATLSGILVTGAVIDRVRSFAISVAAASSMAHGQVSVANTYISGNYTGPLVRLDMTNVTTGRYVITGSDVSGSVATCVDLVNAKNVVIANNTIGTCDTSGVGGQGVEIGGGTATDGISINGNRFADTSGPTTDYAIRLNSNITNSSIANNVIAAQAAASIFYNSGTNSNLQIVNNIVTEAVPTIASAATVALPTVFSPTIILSGTTNVTRLTGGWNGMTLRVICTDGLSLQSGGANPGDFAATTAVPANGMVTITRLSDGKWYVN